MFNCFVEQMYTPYTIYPNVRLKYFQFIFSRSIAIHVYKVYIYREMEKKTISFKADPELREALESQALKKEWTLSYYVESLLKKVVKYKKRA